MGRVIMSLLTGWLVVVVSILSCPETHTHTHTFQKRGTPTDPCGPLSRFREYIYGTSIDTLIEKGWYQIRISSAQVFQQSFDLPHPSRLIAEVLTNETDPYFLWQYDPTYPCPEGCARSGGSCKASS